jgi:putative sugar O-methyltransferase
MKLIIKLYNSLEWRINQKIFYKIISFFSQSTFSTIAKLRSQSDDGNYVRVLKKISENEHFFNNFKKNIFYRQILEHTTKIQGNEYLKKITEDNPILINEIETFKDNDLIGNPNLSNYPTIGDISPTTLRYLKVASDLKTIFKGNIGENICEIGAGYGGQFLILDKIFKIKRYNIFDLKAATLLIEKYLESFLLNSSYECGTLNKCSFDNEFDLVVSNYAFSEIEKTMQIKYIEKILSKSKRGYLTMNSGKEKSEFRDKHLTLKELEKLLPKFEVLDEKPLIWEDNYIIVWGRN